MPYIPTVFVEGGAPGISAAELNKIGTGIEDAAATADAAQAKANTYTAADALAKIKTVDGAGSGLDADKVKGKDATTTPDPDTVVLRDTEGNIAALGNFYVVGDVDGEAMYHLYNNGGVAEWKAGQRSATDHHYKIVKVVAGAETEYFILQSDGKLIIPFQATLQGGLILSNAGDLTLQAATGSAAGDLIFRDAGGVEIGRVWVDQSDGRLSGRSGPNGTYKIWTEEVFGGLNCITLFAGGETNPIVSSGLAGVDDMGTYFVPEDVLTRGRSMRLEAIMKCTPGSSVSVRLRHSSAAVELGTSQVSTTSEVYVRARSGIITGFDPSSSYKIRVYGDGEVGLVRILVY